MYSYLAQHFKYFTIQNKQQNVQVEMSIPKYLFSSFLGFIGLGCSLFNRVGITRSILVCINMTENLICFSISWSGSEIHDCLRIL